MTGAETRFENDQKRARQAQLSNLAAQQSIRPTAHQKRNVNPNALTQPRTAVSSPVMPQTTPQAVPQGQSGSFDPVTDRLIRQVRLEKLISSPEVQDAVSRVNLRDYYHGRNSGPDKGRQVLEILNTYLE